ncbi:hypothetical protein [Paraburkholderia terrae]|uniref:hypothetical protein n=1 Tax=Paraburkholderia terrae TaxID=311230 RepID=UPI001E59613F|nr:hypothetical protein [Paraburkholderia terrae]
MAHASSCSTRIAPLLRDGAVTFTRSSYYALAIVGAMQRCDRWVFDCRDARGDGWRVGVGRIAAGLDTVVYSIYSSSNATTDIETVRVLLFGVLAFSLASALCLRASRVAPVRGGTYFSLPPQRKATVLEVKRLNRPTVSDCAPWH